MERARVHEPVFDAASRAGRLAAWIGSMSDLAYDLRDQRISARESLVITKIHRHLLRSITAKTARDRRCYLDLANEALSRAESRGLAARAWLTARGLDEWLR